MTGKWTTELLDDLQGEGDPFADAVVADYFDQASPTPGQLFREVVATGFRPAELQHPVLAGYRAERVPDPDWLDPAALEDGVSFFAQWGLEIGLGLFCFSLPVGYAAAPVAHVLDLTARLETDPKRRVFETAQMVLDVTSPDGLAEGAAGRETARQVRLIHAAIRHLVTTDPRIEQRAEPPLDTDQHVWCTQWGTPVSQEHLLGTVLAFGYCMLEVLDTLHVRYDERAAEGYLQLWSLVGYLLGVRPDLLPIDRASAAELDPLLRARNLRPTPAGHRMTAALIGVLDRFAPDLMLPGVPAAAMRLLLGDQLADIAGVPSARWLLLPLRDVEPILARLSVAEAHHWALRELVRWLSRSVMTGFVRVERGSGRPPFTIPTHLGWGIQG